MKKFLEKIIHTVIPHEKNGNIPHLLKEEFVFAVSLLVVALFVFNQNNLSIIRGLDLTGAVYPAVIADLTNQDRATAGVSGLAWNTTLEAAAKLKAQDMIQNAYFAHTSPQGITPWHWLGQVNYSFSYAGENLAVDFTESSSVQNAWLNSPTHRANVLSSNFTEIGIAAMEGTYQGRPTTFVVEFFGKPSSFKVAEASFEPAAVARESEPLAEAESSEVAGAAAENSGVTEPVQVVVVEETNEFISVENVNTVAAEDNVQGETVIETNTKATGPIASWYAHLIVNPTQAVKTIYGIVLAMVLLAMLLLLSKEYQKHHRKHLVMGAMLVILVGALFFSLSSTLI